MEYSQVQVPKYDCLLFGKFIYLKSCSFLEVNFETKLTKVLCILSDLDDTLYPLSTGLASSVLKNIQGTLVSRLCAFLLMLSNFFIDALCIYV